MELFSREFCKFLLETETVLRPHTREQNKKHFLRDHVEGSAGNEAFIGPYQSFKAHVSLWGKKNEILKDKCLLFRSSHYIYMFKIRQVQKGSR